MLNNNRTIKPLARRAYEATCVNNDWLTAQQVSELAKPMLKSEYLAKKAES